MVTCISFIFFFCNDINTNNNNPIGFMPPKIHYFSFAESIVAIVFHQGFATLYLYVCIFSNICLVSHTSVGFLPNLGCLFSVASSIGIVGALLVLFKVLLSAQFTYLCWHWSPWHTCLAMFGGLLLLLGDIY